MATLFDVFAKGKHVQFLFAVAECSEDWNLKAVFFLTRWELMQEDSDASQQPPRASRLHDSTP